MIAVRYCAQGRQLFGDKCAHANILQADGIEHSGRGFAEARSRRPGHRFEGKPFDDDSAEPVQIHEVGKFHAVAEGAAGGKNGVGKAQRANVYGEVYCGWHIHRGDSSTRVLCAGVERCGKVSEIARSAR